jgi:hypothetical protein
LPIDVKVSVISVVQKVIRGRACRFVTNATAKKAHTHIALDEAMERSSLGKKNDGLLHCLTG